jgi:glycosyltransferase involved in cell wall biosynthesis
MAVDSSGVPSTIDPMGEIPTLSVLMPVHNAERYLHQSLASALRQTFSDLEVVCVDDGSTDGSLAILRAHAAEDPRIRIIVQQNQGTLHARILAARAARGEFLLYLDADDALERDIAQKTIAKARETGVDAVEFGVRMRSCGALFLRKLRWAYPAKELLGQIIHKPQILTRAVFNESNFLIYSRLIRRTTFLKALANVPPEVLAQRIIYSEDMLLYLTFARHARAIVAIGGGGYRYLRRIQSVTHTFPVQFAAFFQKIENECQTAHAVCGLLPSELRRPWVKFRMGEIAALLIGNNFDELQNAEIFRFLWEILQKWDQDPADREETLKVLVQNMHRICRQKRRSRRWKRQFVQRCRALARGISCNFIGKLAKFFRFLVQKLRNHS